MLNNFLDRLGDWNPQWLRELKGRLQLRNIILTTIISLGSQFLLFIAFQARLPISQDRFLNNSNKYCTGKLLYGLPKCLSDEFGDPIINWQLWWLDLFTWLSICACFSLLVIGIYLLISDLASEERRGTLNFIRLSPQESQNILVGKMLGVPILPYLAIALVIPLHVLSGLTANISFGSILGFDAVVLAACLFYYSAALLFSLVGSWLGGFQAWLGSGVVLGFLLITKQSLVYISTNSAFLFLRFFNPYYFIPRLSDSYEFSSTYLWNDFNWFVLPLENSEFIITGLAIGNFFSLMYFTWQALQRCFRNPNATMLSKRQSYLLTFYFTISSLGCANWQSIISENFSYSSVMKDELACLLFLQFWLFLYLIAAITPHRQTLQDWARYRHIADHKSLGNRYIKDLIWGEKSPSLVAIALNASIAITFLSSLIILANNNTQTKMSAVYALILAGSLAMLYAALAQLMLLKKTRHRIFWTVGSLGAVIVLPVLIMLMFWSNYPGNSNFIGLFSVAAPLLALYTPDQESLYSLGVLFVIFMQVMITGLLILQLRRQLRKVGESTTKVLFATQSNHR
ncbi:hypothetical protein BLD44_015900 [Mastigocladus laminosus UU774]|nr:hypothetical protein B4U84_16700 [Westiellopsis prolifica IICB1]TFI53608.1 hypothetical protein BLD44_015900 [Mastigocladus laminosus UU774]